MEENPFPIIRVSKDYKTHIISLFSAFERKELDEYIPEDLNAFFNSLGDKTFRESITYSEKYWEGQRLQENFLGRWEYEPKEYEEARNRLNDVMQNIGLSIKYYLAWKCFCDYLAAHRKLHWELLYESVDDLRCSITLATEQHYKQSLQALRNFCEIIIALLYFSFNKNALKEWCDDERGYQVPKYENMLKILLEYISTAEANYFKDKYSDLNHSVHSKRRRINITAARLEEECENFGEKHLYEWSNNLNNIIHHALLLYFDCLLKE